MVTFNLKKLKAISMTKKYILPAQLLLGLTFICYLLGGCNEKTFTSSWLGRPMTIDGNDSDWANVPTYFSEDNNVVLGVTNDESNLYLLLKSTNGGVGMQALMGGFTVWFDPTGKKNASFGVRFPMGKMSKDAPWTGKGSDEKPRDRNGPEFLSHLVSEQEQAGLNLIGPTKDDGHWMWLNAAEDLGVRVKMSVERGLFVYELKVPLARKSDSAFGVGIFPIDSTKVIGIGFETSEIERPGKGEHGSESSGEEGGHRGGGGGWGGGGHGGRGGGMGHGGGGGNHSHGGGDGSSFKNFAAPLKYWVRVTLAAKPLIIPAKTETR